MSKSKIIIIGGGASGLVAGIISARNGAKVTIIERKDKIGKKILATGNGRCNISNTDIGKERYHTENQVFDMYEEVFAQCDLSKIIEFFKELGIDVVELESGKLYPMSLQASAVVDVLHLELVRLKVAIITDQEVSSIEYADQFKVITSERTYYGSHVILAAGGKSTPDLGSNGTGYALAEKFGHTLTKVYPSIIQLKTDFPYLRSVKGSKVEGIISLYDDNELIATASGEILFTDYGLSGPPVLDISRIASKRINQGLTSSVQIDMLPCFGDLDAYLIKRINLASGKTASELLIGLINKRLIMPVLKSVDIDIHKKACDITKSERQALVKALSALSMNVTGTNQWNQSQVTSGGINLAEIDSKTLASKIIDHLYICGEIMDVDGDCGGFNLQWAFSTGYIAGLYASGGISENNN
ncbi:MAG: NAD(P)/FAD-dependent oxidoreductase [Vallitaleaceae bacterium]|jgi:predicted Rossmann fold flavoprotein|nr:NAD(P)/FAD-dependent oxidoreductase [Vallitaleaceae bacterium]